MIYDILSVYYDALVRDEEATKAWVDFVKKHCKGNKLLELACGSGDVAQLLMKEGYHIIASDVSEGMLEQLTEKYPSLKALQLDMRDFSLEDKVEGVLCFCDSINYLNDLNEVEGMFKCVYEVLESKGTFLFDMHTPDRLEEFEDGWGEEGYLFDTPYIWEINSEDNEIYHHFVFYSEEGMLQEYHVQQVFDSEDIETMLDKIGFDVEVYTDFIKEGKVPGEKYFYVCRKRN